MKISCCIICAVLFLMGCQQRQQPFTTWEVYRGDKGSTGYSALNQINASNLDHLEVA